VKKLYLLILSVFFVFGVVACGEETTTEAVTTQAVTTEDTTQESTDTQKAEPEILGVSNKLIQEVEEINLLDGITATDAQDGDLTSNLVVEAGDFDFLEAGEYTITVYVVDSDENRVETTFVVTVTDKVFDDLDWAIYDINQLEISLPLDLPASNEAWTTQFYWESSNVNVITTQGFVINPHVGSDPVDVTLTCRAVHGSGVTTKDFVITLQPNPEVEVTSRVQLPFVSLSIEYILTDLAAVDIFYVDNGTVPYVDVQTFINMVQGAIHSDEITVTPEGTNGLSIEYTSEWEDDDGTIEVDEFSAYIDFDANTFTVSNYNFFSYYEFSTVNEYGDGLIAMPGYMEDGHEVTMPLGDYNFDLVIYEEGGVTYYLMPFAVTNQLFLGDMYFDAYYNGDTIYGIDASPEQETIDLARTSSLNDEEVQDDMKLATYNYMAWILDYFYGLADDKGIDSGYDVMSAYAKSILTATDTKLNRRIFDVIYGLDDLHNSYSYPGYYETPYGIGTSVNDLGPRSYSFYEAIWAVQDLFEEKYGSVEAQGGFHLIDNDTVAVIHVTGFDNDTPDEFKVIMDGLPASVVDVVIDLSYNTGGILGSVFRMLGYMTEEPYSYHIINPADGEAYTGSYTSEYVAYDYNWYVLTSKVTFSAGNLFASMAKELGIPIFGQHSTGGASGVSPVILPDGQLVKISSNLVLAGRTGTEETGYDYYSIEYGIEVDYFMSNVASDQQLLDKIAEYKASIAD